ncbi:MAG TPA: hypothetical protein ENJ43_08540 [Gammaproteobacteria bacterium]|nr:hypothetical protein [Gammaproteobacteria bacterium]
MTDHTPTSKECSAEPPDKSRRGGPILPALRRRSETEKQCRARRRGRKFQAGTNRGIETMLRSQYRTHLDLTSLADNKASIMITINGLIISILLATGGSVVAFAENDLYILPIIVLLISGFLSMIYAVLSARPIAQRCCDAIKKPEDFLNGKANVMYFMDNADLSNDEYVEVMKEVMEDKNLVYEEMVSYIHTMSVIIRRKFFLLRTSYSIFIFGLGLCIATFIVVAGVIMLKPDEASAAGEAGQPARAGRFPLASGIYEPSGVHQLGDGRLLVVEDEAGQPFTILSFGPSGEIGTVQLAPARMFRGDGPHRQFRKLDDLEGVDVDSRGYVYAVTSHSRTESGAYGSNRGKLVRFRISGERIVEPVVKTGLKELLLERFPELRRGGALNIEALALNAAQDTLLLGLRAPLDGEGRALLAQLDDPDALFGGGGGFSLAPELIRLDLEGDAIRGMSYDPRLRGYLIVAGSPTKGSGRENRLWFWSGETGSAPRPVVIEGLKGVGNAEGITPVRMNGVNRILLVYDDGNRKASRNASFLLLDYAQLQIAH